MCLIVNLVLSHHGFWSGNLFLIAPFPDLCLFVLFSNDLQLSCISFNLSNSTIWFTIVDLLGDFLTCKRSFGEATSTERNYILCT